MKRLIVYIYTEGVMLFIYILRRGVVYIWTTTFYVV